MLSLLVRRAGEVVPREELKKALWPADTFVEFDQAVNTAVKKIRRRWAIQPIIRVLSKPCHERATVSSRRSRCSRRNLSLRRPTLPLYPRQKS